VAAYTFIPHQAKYRWERRGRGSSDIQTKQCKGEERRGGK